MIREPMVGNIDAIAGALPLCGILTLPDISGKHGQDPMSILIQRFTLETTHLWTAHPSLFTGNIRHG
jgi:hypothetical protein